MYKVIGGIIVISLLTTLPLKNTDYTSNQTIKLNDEVISAVKDDNKKALYHESIDTLMTKANENNININYLLVHKRDIINKIQNIMDVSAHSNINFTEEQIIKFNEFTDNYIKERESLQTKLEMVYQYENLKSLQQELLSSNINYDDIVAKLYNLANNQEEAILLLEKLVNIGVDTLNTLNI